MQGSLGFRKIAEVDNRIRFEIANGGASKIVDLITLPSGDRGKPGAGTIHHVAWRIKTPADQLEWREKIAALGYHITPVIDRNYFKSVYFRERGGILFEIATDSPGFAVDEPTEELGSKVMLPPWMESRRRTIEAMLPAIRYPKTVEQSVDVRQ
jgi:glyoxalase family protein